MSQACFRLLALTSLLACGCSVVRTTADVATSTVSTAAQVTSTGVKVASTAVSTSAAVGSAAVSAGAATRAATAATASTVILGASTLMHWLHLAREEARRDELEHHALRSLGNEQFTHADGRVFTAPGCASPEGMPALLVQLRDGRLELRTAKATAASAGDAQIETQRCAVTRQTLAAKPD